MNAPRDKGYDDYLTTSLKDPSEAAAYIEAVIQTRYGVAQRARQTESRFAFDGLAKQRLRLP